MRYFLKLAYDGSEFHGWQSQPNADSVQERLEKSLSVLFQNSTSITGAGRTDTGVNAREMYAHFDVDCEITDKGRFLTSLNSLAGRNIAVADVIRVHENAHARFDATRRTYRYFVSFDRNPFFNRFSWFSPHNLNLEEMNEAASLLLEVEDFTSFAKLHSDSKTNICKVVQASWNSFDSTTNPFGGVIPENGIMFTISADRFLRNMVRSIVGTLVDVGRGKLSKDGFLDVINGKDRCLAGISMPAHALFLWKIDYPYIPS